MMHQLLIAPIALPLLFACLMLLVRSPLPHQRRWLALMAMVIELAVALGLVVLCMDGSIWTYALGKWQPPFGIVLVADRLAAYMVLISTLLGAAAMLYASNGQDARGTNFHALFQFQLMGINGAFLTGDLFNLFVFFEILLMASYALLLHSGGRKRTIAGMHYVILNVAASSFFLLAAGILYGVLGTLNMADLAVKMPHLGERQAALVESAGLTLLAVFLLKTAILPLHFWLPRAYAAAPGSVAVIFAIMTKIGIYCLLRVYTLVFGPQAGDISFVVHEWLWWGGLATVAAGALGVFASADLRLQISYLTLVSVGTMVAALGMGGSDSISAVLFYLPHTTFITAGLYLIAEVIGRQRGRAATRIVKSRRLRQPRLLAAFYFVGALAILGIPPFSGAIAKVMILATAHGSAAVWLWAVVLCATLAGIVSISRAGTTIFWRAGQDASTRGALLNWRTGGAALGLMSVAVLIPLFAYPLDHYTEAMAAQLANPSDYTEAVLGTPLTIHQMEATR